ncbi:hypothetical protein M8J77_010097 [Diaphorina citri]|nr:hypothetical protein M8J77_010097 [Diaphorina citri]
MSKIPSGVKKQRSISNQEFHRTVQESISKSQGSRNQEQCPEFPEINIETQDSTNANPQDQGTGSQTLLEGCKASSHLRSENLKRLPLG